MGPQPRAARAGWTGGKRAHGQSERAEWHTRGSHGRSPPGELGLPLPLELVPSVTRAGPLGGSGYSRGEAGS